MRPVRSFRKRLAWLRWPEGHGVVRREGALFLVNMRNWVDKITVTAGVMEREQIAYFLEHVERRQCTTFLDVGANMGTYSMLVALRYPDIRIVAFEPDPRSFDHMRANALLNGLSRRIDSRQVAASSFKGSLSFIFAHDGHDALSPAGEAQDGCRVPCVRLDDELPELRGACLAIKMDVERHELEALAGMKRLLTENKCFLQIECFEENWAALLRLLTSLGYQHIHEIGVDRYLSN